MSACLFRSSVLPLSMVDNPVFSPSRLTIPLILFILPYSSSLLPISSDEDPYDVQPSWPLQPDASRSNVSGTLSSVVGITPVHPWCEVKSRRGAPKRISRSGFACQRIGSAVLHAADTVALPRAVVPLQRYGNIKVNSEAIVSAARSVGVAIAVLCRNALQELHGWLQVAHTARPSLFWS